MGLGATAVATAWLYRIDEVITVQGRLVPSKGGVEVKSPSSGQLEKVLVKNGEEVQKGQTLFIFDVEAARAEEETIMQQLKLEANRLREKTTSNIQRQETLKRNIVLTERILSKLRPLERAGAISEIQILQKENELETQRDQLLQLEIQQQEAINDSLSRSADLEGRLIKIQNQLKNEVVIAPISGTIFDLKPDNDKYVATNAEPLLKIVPKGALGGEVNVGNQDIGFIRPGQTVKVRVDSFPYTQYGEINGRILRIGADALPPNELVPQYHFPVDLQLEKSNLTTREGLKIPLQAGMTITTNLKLRDRKLIELVGDIFANRNESLKRLRQP